MRVEAVVGGAKSTENQDTPNLETLRIFFQNINILKALLTWEIGEACVSPFIPVSLVCYVCIRGDEMIFDI